MFRNRRLVVMPLLCAAAAALAACDSGGPFSPYDPVELKCKKVFFHDDLDEPIEVRQGIGNSLFIFGGSACETSGGKSRSSSGGAADAGFFEAYDPAKGRFVRASRASIGGAGARSTILTVGPLAGAILITGGLTGEAKIKKDDLTSKNAEASDDAWLFEPKKGRVRRIGSIAIGSTVGGRLFHTATELPDGKVLIAGGTDATMAPIGPAVVFDPKSGVATLTVNDMRVPRYLHSATALPNGRVLIVGGVDDDATTLSAAEVFNPQIDAFTGLLQPVRSPDGKLAPLAGHTATLIERCGCAADGKVLIAGGFSGSGITTSSNVATLFDPATGVFGAEDVDQLTDSRLFHTATPLGDGKLLLAGGMAGQADIIGGISGIEGAVRQSAEIFDAKSLKIECVGGATGQGDKRACRPSMVNGRAGHVAARLDSGPAKGGILLAGGVGGAKAANGKLSILKTAEIFDADKLKFSKTGEMKAGRVFASSAPSP